MPTTDAAAAMPAPTDPSAELSSPSVLETFDAITATVKQKLLHTQTQLSHTSAQLAASASLLAAKETSISCLKLRVATLEDALACATTVCKEQKSRIARLKMDACEKARVIAQLQREIADLELEEAEGEVYSCVLEGKGEKEDGEEGDYA